MDPAIVNPDNGLARVERTMQLATAPSSKASVTKEGLSSVVAAGLDISASSSKEGEFEDSSAPKADTKPSVVYPHIFAIGDAADAFGAIAAGHNAYAQVSQIRCSKPCLGFCFRDFLGMDMQPPNHVSMGLLAFCRPYLILVFLSSPFVWNRVLNIRQGEIAGRNVLRLVRRALNNDGAADLRCSDSEGLEQYTPRAPAIKVSLGLVRRSLPLRYAFC